jgi:hypothetical protein
VSLGNVVDELLNQHSLADTGTTEETNLATTSVGREEIDDLDTSLKHLSGGRLLDERRRIRVDGQHLDALNGAALINGLANDVHDTTKSGLADGNENGSTSIDDLLATDETLGTVHGNGTDGVLTEVGRDLEDELTTMEVLDVKGVQDGREGLRVKLDIDDGTNDGLDRAGNGRSLSRVRARYKFRSNVSSHPHSYLERPRDTYQQAQTR